MQLVATKDITAGSRQITFLQVALGGSSRQLHGREIQPSAAEHIRLHAQVNAKLEATLQFETHLAIGCELSSALNGPVVATTLPSPAVRCGRLPLWLTR